jgi:thiamine kinase-like enzyme
MTRPALSSAAGITPAWLTDVLRDHGTLADGRVTEVAVEAPRTTLVSSVATVRVAYAPPVPAGVPTRLFLKMTRDGLALETFQPVGLAEVEFYRTVAPLMAEPPVPRCYDAAFDAASGRFHLLLEDLSETHAVVSDWPLPPTDAQCEGIVETYARFHAAWWDDPRLGHGVGALLDLGRYTQVLAESVGRFVDFLGERLSRERRARYERMLGASARLARRHLTGKHVTLVHNDAHVWNLLYPRSGVTRDVRLIDWDSWRPRIAARDLAYMMAVHWYPDRRRRCEADLLRRYHAALETHGVRGYALDALRDDYRLAVVEHLSLPVFQWAAKLGSWIWWGHLERIMLAFEDLGCEELL